MDIIPSMIDKLEKSYINAFKLGASNGNPKTFQDPAKKQEFKDHFRKLCELEQAKAYELNLIRNFECPNVESFDVEFANALAQIRKDKTNTQDNQRYQRFASEIDKIIILDDSNEEQCSINETVDDDMTVQETQIFIDPFSKTQIRDPVKNIICGHIYEKGSIEAALNVNKRTKCAYMGCNNRKAITNQDLQEDYGLKAKLDLLYAQTEQRMVEDED